MNEEKYLSAPLCEMLVQQKHCATVVLNNYTTFEDTNDIKPGVLTYNSTSDDLNIKPCVLTAYSISDDLRNIKPVLNNSRATNVVKANVLLSYQTSDSSQAKTELVNDLIGLQMISSSINDCSVQLSNYTQNQFMNHENERQIPKSFLCQNTLNGKQNLKQNQHRKIDSVGKSHMLDGPTKFDIVDKKYECDVCLAKFATRRYLRQHKTTSLHSDRRYQCNLCGKEITSNDLLKKHMRVHGKKKVQSKNKYRCDLCNKTFISEIHLEKHIKIHSIPSRRGQLFACDVCHKEFSVKKYLYLHKKTHSEKIFQCDLCDKRFALSRYLKSHANCHLIEKPHKCKFCNKSYATKDQLAIHLIKLHYFCETFTCTVCHEEFYQKKFIMKHIRMQHPTHAGNENLFIVTNKGFNVNVDEVLNGKNLNKTKAHSQQKEDIKPGPSTTKTSHNFEAETARLIYHDEITNDLAHMSTTKNKISINSTGTGNNIPHTVMHNEHVCAVKEETKPFVLNEHVHLLPNCSTHSEHFLGIKTETFNDLTEIKILQTRLIGNTSLVNPCLPLGGAYKN